jgi:hypothetical protein
VRADQREIKKANREEEEEEHKKRPFSVPCTI